MKNKLIIAGSLLVTFVVGFVCANVFQARRALAKSTGSEMSWEKIKIKNDPDLKKLRMTGGWLVITDGGPHSRSMAYVPDPNHQWQ